MREGAGKLPFPPCGARVDIDLRGMWAAFRARGRVPDKPYTFARSHRPSGINARLPQFVRS